MSVASLLNVVDRHTWTQVVFDFVQNETDGCFIWNWIVGDLSLGISCSCDGSILPREEEDDATILRSWIYQPHIMWRIVVCIYNMIVISSFVKLLLRK